MASAADTGTTGSGRVGLPMRHTRHSIGKQGICHACENSPALGIIAPAPIYAAVLAAFRRKLHPFTAVGASVDSDTIDMAAPWRRYQREIPRDWIILGTIRCDSDHSTGALARSAIGVYVQFNAGGAHTLDQHAVLAALHHATQASGIHRA